MTDSPDPMVGGRTVIDDVLDTATADLRFVLARRHLPTAEAMSLREGQVLTFAVTVPPPVALVVGETVLAKGELIDVDGARGVRVVELTGSIP